MTFPCHRGQDVIGCAIDDPVDGPCAVTSEPLLQRSYDGNASPNARLEAEVKASLLGLAEDLGPVNGKQRLVCGYHGLPCPQGCQNELTGRLVSTDQLDHDVDRGICNELAGIGREQAAVHTHTTIGTEVEVGNAREPHRAPELLADG